MTIKLTKEQYNAINILAVDGDIVKDFISGNLMESLDNLTLDEFLKCLYMQDYVVDPEFKIFEVGDYVFSKTWGKAGKVVTTNDTVITTVSFKDHVRNMRHATESEIQQEKERRFWARHGRDVWELRVDDILTINDEISVVQDVEYNLIFLKTCRLTNKEFENLKHNIEVVCFAENRLDVNHDDE